MKISLAIICKDETEQLKRIIKDYSGYFDEICIAIDIQETLDEIAKLNDPKVKLFKYEWVNNFADKHNFLTSKISNEYYFRLDCDDAIIHPENIDALAEYAKAESVSIVYCYYYYSKDEWGNCNAAHYREGLIRKDDNLYWNKEIHENILPKDTTNFKIFLDDKHSVVYDHLIDASHVDRAVERNIQYLIREYNKDKEKTDPRTIGYLGRMFASVKDYDKAIFFLQKHIELSGWDEDRYFSWTILSDTYRERKEYDTAIACAFEALQERTDYPDAYLRLMDVYFDQEKWSKAIEWGTTGLIKEVPRTFMLLDPSSYGWRPTLKLAFAYFKTDNFKKAWELMRIVQRQVPTFDFVLENATFFQQAAEHQEYIEKFIWMVKYLENKQAKDKVRKILDVVPNDINEHEIIIKLRHKYFPPRTWGDKEITIFCGQTAEAFSPKSIKTGIGGSEEAVICLSRELTKLGWKVTVYNNCGDDEGEYEGVTYLNWIKFNIADIFNVFVAWRGNMFDLEINAKSKIVWMHDIPQEANFKGELSRFFDKVVMLSEYHKTLLPKDVPNEKIYISTNGLNPEDFKGLEEIKRNPHRVIYASSYNRGLEQLLEIWGDVKKEVPDAELHIMYGWTVYDLYVKEGFVKDDGFKKKMVKLMMQDGVYEHGRIGHKELLKEYAKSGIFAYPCTYTGEINCIALTKAIACGCIPVTNDFAVLKERNPDFAVKDKDFKDKLIYVLKNGTYVPKNRTDYIQENSWETVALDWSKRILPPTVETEMRFYQEFLRYYCEPDAKIVDIGCAEGHTFRPWEKLENVTHVDLDDHSYLPNFVRTDAKELPFKDKEFDIAVLGEILEHVPDPIPVLKEAKRVAKKLVISVPYENEWRDKLLPFMKIEDKEKSKGKTRVQLLKEEGKIPLEKFESKDNYEHLWHHRFYTPETLKQDLEKVGIDNARIIKTRFSYWSHLGAIVNV